MAGIQVDSGTRPEAAALAALLVDAFRHPEKRLMLALLEDDHPSGRYRAQELVEVVTA